MAHRNIPLFIPHMGCPHQCVFCDQRAISGQERFCEDLIPQQLERAVSTVSSDDDCEIAFFGGSFTGIDRGLMIRLLELAESYVQRGVVQAIRLSTRPDMIDREILAILGRYSVKTVELGLQSMNDRVLIASERGHTAECGARACEMVREAGFSLVGQMMIGLPASTVTEELETAERICSLGANACRVYPTVVFHGTSLARMTERGIYRPLTLNEAVERSARVVEVLEKNGVGCLRVGLCASEELTSEARVMAGPNHPALGELVWNEIFYQRLLRLVTENRLLGNLLELRVTKKDLSKAVGQHRCNLERLERETGARVQRICGVEQACVLSLHRIEKKLYEGEHQACI
ncbi:MAG: radical SAM protein [Ruminococcaceae bacterium]|nr:radical SAM protein [Oscillospiraceae bacterium]